MPWINSVKGIALSQPISERSTHPHELPFNDTKVVIRPSASSCEATFSHEKTGKRFVLELTAIGGYAALPVLPFLLVLTGGNFLRNGHFMDFGRAMDHSSYPVPACNLPSCQLALTKLHRQQNSISIHAEAIPRKKTILSQNPMILSEKPCPKKILSYPGRNFSSTSCK